MKDFCYSEFIILINYRRKKTQIHQSKPNAIISLVYLLTFIFSLTNTFASNSEEEKLVKAYKNSDYTGCIEYATKLLWEGDEYKESITIHAYLGMAYFENKQLSKAKSILRKIDLFEKTDQNSFRIAFEAYQTLSDIYWHLLNQDSATIWNNKAYTLLEKLDNNQYLIAIDDFQKGKLALNTDEDKSKSLISKAFQSFDKNDSRILDIYTIMSYFIGKSSGSGAVTDFLNEGIKMQKERFQNDTLRLINLQLQKAYMHFLNNDLKSSEEVFENDVRPLLFKKHTINQKRYSFQKGEFYRLALSLYAQNGDFEKCIEYGKKYLEIAPDFIAPDNYRYGEVYRDIAKNYLAIGRVATHVDYMKKAISIFEKSDFYKDYLPKYKADTYFRDKDYTNAILWCDMILNSVSPTYYDGYIAKILEIKLRSLLYLQRYQEVHAKTDEIIHLLQNKYPNRFSYLSFYHLVKLGAYEIQRNMLDLTDSINITQYNAVTKNLNHYYNDLIPKYLEEKRASLDHAEIFTLYAYHKIKTNALDSVEFFLKKADEINIQKENLSQNKYTSNKLELLNHSFTGELYYKRYKNSSDINHLETALKSYLSGNDTNNKETNGSIEDKLEQIGRFLPRFNDKLLLTLQELWVKQHDEKYIQIALNLMEKRKSSLLIKSQKTKEASYLLNLPDSVLLKQSSLNQQISYLENQLNRVDQKRNSSLFQSLQHQLTIVKSKMELFKESLKNTYPEYHQIRNNPGYINIEEVQNSLEKNEALLHYYSGKYHSFVLVATKDKKAFIKIDPISDNTLRKFRNSLNPTEVNKDVYKTLLDYSESANEIYKSQLKQVLTEFSHIKKFYVIPDGLLHYVPFEALISEKPDNINGGFKNLNYLIKDYTFSYGYSATTLFTKKRNQTSSSNMLAFAPAYNNENQTLSNPFGGTRAQLKELKWNTDEVSGIKELFKGKFLMAGEANKLNFKKSYNDYKIIHLAMHAIVNEEEPMYSHLAFSQNDEKGESSFLHAFEIFRMNFNAEMIVLSACNSGYGKLYNGEGAMSLAKAFSFAGCRSTVMSYWPADDKASGEIMQSFYTHLSNGDQKDVALRKAKLSYFENSDQQSSAPAFWNNFVVSGDVKPITDEGFKWYWMIIIAILIISTGVFIAKKKLFG